MKICYIVSTAEVAGGANRSLLEMIELIKLKGHECVVLCPSYGSMTDELQNRNIAYKVISYKNSIRFGNFIRNKLKNIYNTLEKRKIIRFLQEEKIDLVHNNSLPTIVGMEAANLLNIPYICHIRENIWSGLGMKFIKDSAAKKVIRNARTNIAISEFIKKVYVEFEPKGNYVVINDGISVDDYYEEKQIFNDDVVRIGIVGVINPQKGQEDAVRAVEILKNKGYKNIILEIIGKDGMWDGTKKYSEDLRKYVTDKKLEFVKFLGTVDNTGELKKIRSTQDINLVCSRAEGLGRTTIESMLSGCLTIAANAGATPELLEHMQQGLLYECGNPTDLANKIEYAINNIDDMKEIALNGQICAKRLFSIEKYVDEISDIYNSIIEQ